jgi:hypothetical protein
MVLLEMDCASSIAHNKISWQALVAEASQNQQAVHRVPGLLLQLPPQCPAQDSKSKVPVQKMHLSKPFRYAGSHLCFSHVPLWDGGQ